MTFYNEKDVKINIFAVERDEQLQAQQYIRPTATVLELGARYGTVTSVISKKLTNPMRLVAVEPDERVWHTLERNLVINGCSCRLIKGVISRKPIILVEQNSYGGYGTSSAPAETSIIAQFTLEEIESKYDLRFDTLVADCEGFLEVFMDENPVLYDQLTMILFEKDCPHKCNYDKIIATLRAKGFRQLVAGFHEVWEREV